jgi:tryptophanyl-tRNA synthetase
MTADIFHFGGTHIPVGADQVQHIEFARDMVDVMAFHGVHFQKPEAVLSSYPRIMSLTDGTKKMSKSSGEGCLYVDDSEEEMRAKIMAAKTGGSMLEDTPEIRNLKTIYSAFGGTENHMKFKDFKEELAALIIEELKCLA